ncbi:Putative transposase, RpnA-like [Desulfonema limicola]|uniref:Transposase, RpnA-like n=1 Tax=Desulfonema limicola TaxID=45656 RepID=A0A975B4B6_9BACT|nr:Rpn family recombination-promoting nuclease/putative transposase [Desulfonema limicola]QTA78544.1 Putative transposase, RpnA-like [Desulfonema limicola]
MKFIDPRIDFAFKKIFGSEDTKEILISFLESLLELEGDKRIREIQIGDPYLMPRIEVLKLSILDVKCTDHRGVSYIVEMQIRKTRAFLKRIQYNASKTYVNQISKADDYPKLNQVIAVTITDFSIFDPKDVSHYVSCHITTEKENGGHFLNGIVYYFIELSKFDKTDKVPDNILDKWIYFIKMAGELESVPEKMREEPFDKAFEKAMLANMTLEESEYYDKACMAVADARGAIELALEEGMEKERVIIARKMLKKGTDIEYISEITGFTLEQIQHL